MAVLFLFSLFLAGVIKATKREIFYHISESSWMLRVMLIHFASGFTNRDHVSSGAPI